MILDSRFQITASQEPFLPIIDVRFHWNIPRNPEFPGLLKKTILFIFRDASPVHLVPCLPILWILAHMKSFYNFGPVSNHFWLFWGFLPIWNHSNPSWTTPVCSCPTQFTERDWIDSKTLKGICWKIPTLFVLSSFWIYPRTSSPVSLERQFVPAFQRRKTKREVRKVL